MDCSLPGRSTTLRTLEEGPRLQLSLHWGLRCLPHNFPVRPPTPPQPPGSLFSKAILHSLNLTSFGDLFSLSSCDCERASRETNSLVFLFLCPLAVPRFSSQGGVKTILPLRAALILKLVQ